MRPLLHGDLVAAARALIAVAPQDRSQMMRRLIAAAELAHRHRRRFGRAHPDYGSGSLMGAAAAWPRGPERMLDDPDYLNCLACVIDALRRRMDRR